MQIYFVAQGNKQLSTYLGTSPNTYTGDRYIILLQKQKETNPQNNIQHETQKGV